MTTTLTKARLYAQYRLPYPPQLVEDLLTHTGPVQVVADIGAGTGQLARLFAQACPKVFAVEPDPAMRAIATDALTALPTVEVCAGAAEQTGLAERSVDLIVVGNAFHRFRSEACFELKRILKPSGWAALVSYTFTDQAFNDHLFSQLAALPRLTTRIENAWRKASLTDLFGTAPTHTLRYPQTYRQDWPAFFGAARSGIEAPEPGDAEFEQFQAINRAVFEAFAVAGEIPMEYETQLTFGQPGQGEIPIWNHGTFE